MEREWERLQGYLAARGDRMTRSSPWPGMTLVYWDLTADRDVVPDLPWEQTLAIHHCRSGRLGWQMPRGTSVFLGPGDHAVHSMADSAGAVLTLPNGTYEGLSLFLDLSVFSEVVPDLLAGTGLTAAGLREKFCRGQVAAFAGNEESDQLFRGFYDRPPRLREAYRKLKTAELLLYLWQKEDRQDLSAYSAEQIAIIRAVHDGLTQHLDRRVTIEALARQYHMNQTTLKRVFKAVYGNSVAAHMKEHRMEQAAHALLETEQSVAEIARSVGYDSQSRFSKAFQETFSVLPTEFRRNHRRAEGTVEHPVFFLEKEKKD